ncbi:hypothetical protein STENM327S_07783 [Streptomyces tendae]
MRMLREHDEKAVTVASVRSPAALRPVSRPAHRGLYGAERWFYALPVRCSLGLMPRNLLNAELRATALE